MLRREIKSPKNCYCYGNVIQHCAVIEPTYLTPIYFQRSIDSDIKASRMFFEIVVFVCLISTC